MSALMHMQPIFYDTHPAGKVVWRGEEPAMRKRLITLIAAMLLLVVVAAQAQPLTATSSFSITFTPVLVQETVEEGQEEGNMVYGPTVTFRWAYRVSSN